ncbi:ORF6N domain-containing protein [archaeon]|jgi:hypothetical protein|nr:ORF6N domain-containing protein [archaeon]
MNQLTSIKSKILLIRGSQVMIDFDLAKLYGVSTGALNQAIKRNFEKFPEDFMFRLTEAEKAELITKCDNPKLKFSPALPNVFTEHGIISLSGVLKSDIATKINIQIMRAFVTMRKFIASNAGIFQRLGHIEKKQIEFDDKFEEVFEAIEDKSLVKKQGIFFDGQIFDAYTFVSKLIKSAEKSIVLIDNYVDESVLTILSKRKKNVACKIYTQNTKDQLKLDLKKHNSQYPGVTLHKFKKSHDRFLIIDNKEVYHIGASLKDLGKKWFAFSKFDKSVLEMLDKLP